MAYGVGLLALFVLGLVGWVLNFIDVIHLADAHAPLDAMFIVRIVGIPVALVGAVMGFF